MCIQRFVYFYLIRNFRNHKIKIKSYRYDKLPHSTDWGFSSLLIARPLIFISVYLSYIDTSTYNQKICLAIPFHHFRASFFLVYYLRRFVQYKCVFMYFCPIPRSESLFLYVSVCFISLFAATKNFLFFPELPGNI